LGILADIIDMKALDRLVAVAMADQPDFCDAGAAPARGWGRFGHE